MKSEIKEVKTLQALLKNRDSDQQKESDEFEASVRIVEKLLKKKKRKK